MKIELGNIIFVVLIPVIFAFMLYSYKKFKPFSKNQKRIFITRIIIYGLLTLSLVNISVKIKGKNITTIFLLDVSESASEFKNLGKEFIANSIEEMPKGNKAGVVLFGFDTKLDRGISKSKEYKTLGEVPIITSTDIESAIERAYSLFDKTTSKRIVLITDGEENNGDMLKSIPIINNNNIDFKVLKINKNSKEEVYVDKITVPDNTAVEEEFTVTIDVKSNLKTDATLTLFSGRNKVSDQKVTLQKGNNTFVFKDKQLTGGFKSYRVLVEAEKDNLKINNEGNTFTNVKDKPYILVVNGINGGEEEISKILKQGGANVKVINPFSAPSNLNEFLEYKTIVLNNVHIDDLPKGFINNVKSYVKDYGGGIVTFGGEDAYALGGYKDTDLEEVLPVYMDKRGKNEVPAISINLIIDKSGSMSSQTGSGISNLTLAKEAAIKALENLREVDDISVISFDDKYNIVVPLQKISDRFSIEEKILGISLGGGTSIYPALEQGYNIQVNSAAKIKHTILLTDGQDSYGFQNYKDLLEKFNFNDITLSTVAVGNGADTNLLTALSTLGGGRSYYTDIYTDIPRIFAKEVLLSAGTYVLNEEFTPKILINHEILSGVKTSNGIPNLLGYIGTAIKENAIEILSSNNDEPVLAAWEYGIGRAVSFTSDITGEWSSNYINWDHGPQLFKNMVYYTIPNYSGEGILDIYQEGSVAKVEFYNDSIGKEGKINGIYTDEEGNTGNFELLQTEPGKYTAEVPLTDLGFYNFSVREEVNGEVKNNYNGAFAMQFSEEYKFNENNEKLDGVIKETNGGLITTPEEVFIGKFENSYKIINLTNPLLLIALLLFLLDVAYRRLNLVFDFKFIKRFINEKLEIIKDEKSDKAKNSEEKKVEELKEIKDKNINNDKKETLKNSINNKKQKQAKSEIIKDDKKKTAKKSNTKKKEDNKAIDTKSLLKKKNDRTEI